MRREDDFILYLKIIMVANYKNIIFNVMKIILVCTLKLLFIIIPCLTSRETKSGFILYLKKLLIIIISCLILFFLIGKQFH